METLREAFAFLTDVQGLVMWGGIVAIGVIIFVETGLLVGFFLPGDSLLVTAGIVAAAGTLDLATLLIVAFLCAVAGDQVGYQIGRVAGLTLYRRPDSFFFRRKHLERARDFYAKHGPKTIVLARFIPIIRTFAPTVAGAAQMRYTTFVFYNVAGGFLWVFSMVLAGYFLGRSFPAVIDYLHWIIAIVVFLSILPGVIEIWRNRRAKAAVA